MQRTGKGARFKTETPHFMGCYSGVHRDTSGDTPRKSSICFFVSKPLRNKNEPNGSSIQVLPSLIRLKKRCHRPQVCAPALWHDFTRSCGMLKLAIGHWPVMASLTAGEIAVPRCGWEASAWQRDLDQVGSQKPPEFCGEKWWTNGKTMGKHGENHGENEDHELTWRCCVFFLLGNWMSWAYFQTKHLKMWRDEVSNFWSWDFQRCRGADGTNSRCGLRAVEQCGFMVFWSCPGLNYPQFTDGGKNNLNE